MAQDLAAIRANTMPVPDRHLTVEQIGYIQSHLARFPKQAITISYLVGDPECLTLAREFVQVLSSPPLSWEAGLGLPRNPSFIGIAITYQDPTAVPEAAEALAKTLEAKGITVLRLHDGSGVSINGTHASPAFGLIISKKGTTTVPPHTHLPLRIPALGEHESLSDPTSLSNEGLATVAHEVANAMRAFETNNREQFENEWRVVNDPVPKGSYRDVFENYRQWAIALRDELWKRLGSPKATTQALDADTLAGVSPMTDAANYLDLLARNLMSPKP
jgi:hypothetical protein